MLWLKVLHIGWLCCLPFLISNVSSPAQRVWGCTVHHHLSCSHLSGIVLLLGTINIQGVSLHSLLFLTAQKKQVGFYTWRHCFCQCKHQGCWSNLTHATYLYQHSGPAQNSFSSYSQILHWQAPKIVQISNTSLSLIRKRAPCIVPLHQSSSKQTHLGMNLESLERTLPAFWRLNT